MATNVPQNCTKIYPAVAKRNWQLQQHMTLTDQNCLSRLAIIHWALSVSKFVSSLCHYVFAFMTWSQKMTSLCYNISCHVIKKIQVKLLETSTRENLTSVDWMWTRPELRLFSRSFLLSLAAFALALCTTIAAWPGCQQRCCFSLTFILVGESWSQPLVTNVVDEINVLPLTVSACRLVTTDVAPLSSVVSNDSIRE